MLSNIRKGVTEFVTYGTVSSSTTSSLKTALRSRAALLIIFLVISGILSVVAVLPWASSPGMVAAIGSMITAVIAFLAFGVAALTLLIEHHRERLHCSVELFMTLRDHYNSDAMKHKRHVAARTLIENLDNAIAPGDEEFEDAHKPVIEIMNFWETVGFFVDRGALDKKMAWHIFSPEVLLYWHATKEYVYTCQDKDKTVYEKVASLVNTILEIDREKYDDKEPYVPSRDELRNSLATEVEDILIDSANSNGDRSTLGINAHPGLLYRRNSPL